MSCIVEVIISGMCSTEWKKVEEILKSLEGIPEVDNPPARLPSPFPVPELRQHRERVPRHSATIHIVPPHRTPFLPPSPKTPPKSEGIVSYERALKIAYDGTTKKISKGQVIKVEDGRMYITDEKGKNEQTLKDNIQIVNKRLVGKKEVELTDSENKTYQLQFDKERDAKHCLETSRPRSNSVNEKTTIKNKLLRLLRKRSSRDFLEKKGIIKLEPIFGNTLKNLQVKFNCNVPVFVTKSIALIELEKNITSQGVYRTSGNLATIQKVRFEVDRYNYNILEEYSDEVDVLTGALKLFFRELSEPIVDHETYEEFLKLSEVELPKASEKISRLVNKLPKSHKDTLMIVINHLLKVELYKEENRMDLHNLSVVWGPSLFWFPESCNSENLLKNSTNTVRVMELVLNVYKLLSSPGSKAESPSNTHRKILNRSIESIISSSSTSPVLNKRLSRTDSKEAMSQSSDSISSRDYCLKSPMSAGIFGNTLQNLSEISKQNVPEFVYRVTSLIEKNIKCVGVYRQSGDKSRIDKIKKKVNKNKLASLDKYKNDTVELACVLKQFFKELKEPLIPQSVFDEFEMNYGTDDDTTSSRLQDEINKIHPSHKETLLFLLEHLSKIIENTENKMSKEAISIVWAPTLCHLPANNKEVMSMCAKLIESLLDTYASPEASKIESLKNRSRSIYDNVRGEASLLDDNNKNMERKTKL